MKSTKLKTKQEKGITLIALIITIVVLMILAAVAINSITNDGIIGKAESVANTYNEKVNEEQAMLDYYELLLSGKAWTQNGTTVSRDGQTLNVGEKVNLKVGTADPLPYSDSIAEGAEGDYTGDWVVLGAENGKILLVSSSNVKSSVMLRGAYGDTSRGYEAGYYNGVEYLNNLCSKYKNELYADSARSITIEDINRVTGYDVVKKSNYVTVNFTSWHEHIDGYLASVDNPISMSGFEIGYAKLTGGFVDPENDLTSAFGNGLYWLGTQFVSVNEEIIRWGLLTFENYWGFTDSAEECDICPTSLFHSTEGARPVYEYGARAVVSIKPEIEVVKAS